MLVLLLRVVCSFAKNLPEYSPKAHPFVFLLFDLLLLLLFWRREIGNSFITLWNKIRKCL